MSETRRHFTPEFKAQVALCAVYREHTIQKIAEQFNLHPNLVAAWKKELKTRAKEIFQRKTHEKYLDTGHTATLEKRITQLQEEIDFLAGGLVKPIPLRDEP